MSSVRIVWAIRTICIILVFLVLGAIETTFSLWKNDKNLKRKQKNIYPKSMHGISLLFNCVALLMLIINSIPDVCESMNGLWFMSWSVSKGFLVIYQILRLQSFLSESNIAFCREYSKFVFYSLYSIVIFCMVYNLGVSHFSFNIKVMDGTVCMEQLNSVIFAHYQLPVAVIDFAPDFIILYLYLWQSINAKKYISNLKANVDKIVPQVKALFNKMVILQCVLIACYAIQWLVYIIIIYFGSSSDMKYQYLILNIVRIIGLVIFVVVGYLIDLHIRIYNNFKESTAPLVSNKIDKDNRKDSQEKNDIPTFVNTPTDTQSKNPLPQRMEEGNASPITPGSGKIELGMMTEIR